MPVGAQVVRSSHNASKGLSSGVFSLGRLLDPLMPQNWVLPIPPFSKLSPVGGFVVTYVCVQIVKSITLYTVTKWFLGFLGSVCVLSGIEFISFWLICVCILDLFAPAWVLLSSFCGIVTYFQFHCNSGLVASY